MAASKTTKKAVAAPSATTTAKKKKGGVKPATTAHRESVADPSVELAPVTQIVASLPANTAVEENSFTGQFSDARCETEGAKTVAVNVLREASAAVAGMVAVITANGPLMAYALTRLRFLAECIQQLGAAVATQSALSTTGSVTEATLVVAREAARTARTGFADSLKTVAEGNTGAETLLKKARGVPHNDAETVGSINALVALARSWITGSDASLASLCASHFVTEANCVATVNAGSALAAAVTAHAGSSPARDLPSTNIIEGRVILELGVLYRAVELGQTRNKSIPSMVMGATLRRSFGAHATKTGDATITEPASASLANAPAAPTTPLR